MGRFAARECPPGGPALVPARRRGVLSAVRRCFWGCTGHIGQYNCGVYRAKEGNFCPRISYSPKLVSYCIVPFPDDGIDLPIPTLGRLGLHFGGSIGLLSVCLFRGEVSPFEVHSQQGKGGDGAYTMFGQQVPAFPRDGRSETV